MEPPLNNVSRFSRWTLKRSGSILGLILMAVLAIGIGIWLGTPSETPDFLEEDLEKAIFTAIRNGDAVAVRTILNRGINLETHNEIGDTPLMQALLHGNAPIIASLLKQGARVNSRGLYNVTPLLRAIHDPGQVQILLAHQARVDARAMVLAAMIAGSRPTLEMLQKAGGNVNAEIGGFTPLMAAAYCNDREAARWLIEQGANVKARTETGCTALMGASVAGNAALVKLLLERGADPNARYQEPHTQGDFQTPALNAAWHGHTDCLELLLQHGADGTIQGGPFGRSPLLCAATTGNVKAIHQLLARGASKDVQDFLGRRPADWANLRGDPSFTRLLGEASTPSDGEATDRRVRLNPGASGAIQIEAISDGVIEKALAASLPLLQQSGQKLTRTRNCVTCHQHSLVAMTVGLARQQGFPVNEQIASEERQAIKSILDRKVPLLLLGADIDPTLAAYSLVGFAAEKQAPSLLTDALVHYLVLHQQQEGHWAPEAYRPPEDGSPFLFTAYAVRGLSVYASPGRAREIEERVQRARQWLLAAKPQETVDQVFQIFGLLWSQAPPPAIDAAMQQLKHQQRPDGGWSQLPTLPSDAYATGQTLCALLEAGMKPDCKEYRRGIAFLLQNQQQDGSWFVPSRCFPALEYSSSGFPHGRSQFISAAATCWASMALARARGIREDR